MLENFLAYFAYTEYLQSLYFFCAMPNSQKKILVDGTPLHFQMQIASSLIGLSNDVLFVILLYIPNLSYESKHYKIA